VIFLVALVGGALLLWLAAGAFAAIPPDLQSVPLYGDVKTQVDSLDVQAGYVQAEIDKLDGQLESYTESFNQMQLRLTDVNNQMSAYRRDLKAAQDDHAYRVAKFQDRICALYKSGGTDEFLSLLLDSTSLDDLVNRVRLVATLADQDKDLVANLDQSTKNLSGVLAHVDQSKQEELGLRKQIEDQQKQIQATLDERQTTLAGIDSQITVVIAKEKQRQQEEQARLRQALTALLNGGQIYSGPLPQTNSEILNQFLETAAYYIGIPYVWAGDRPSTGFDCSGYVAFVFRQHGVDLPHYSGYQAEMGYPVSLDQIQPGDLVAFGNPVHHVGIYIGDDLFIHAPRTNDVVKISHLSERTDLAAIRRFDLQPRSGPPAVW
jgi:cell wall-associated NlpC family hydrolase